jgi:peptidoglycan hydrolase-like protein with peptidoglycan-binding domain
MRPSLLPVTALLTAVAALSSCGSAARGAQTAAAADVTIWAPTQLTGADSPPFSATVASAASSRPQPDSPIAGVEVIASTLQSELQLLGYKPGSVDGKFGAQTQSALRAFQAARGVAAEERGALGPKTAAARSNSSAPPSMGATTRQRVRPSSPCNVVLTSPRTVSTVPRRPLR